ncbi:hypothetical protein ACFVWX_29045 [Streptomyces sp. NPDC058220]|uniref:hypothetical protein n=1 Tax=Streptomyces sp. NPDC058220 TaxID=3346387 RepID=UPI0036EE0091
MSDLKAWRKKQDEHFIETGQRLDETGDEVRWMTQLTPASYDVETGCWGISTMHTPIEVPLVLLRPPAWTEVAADPRADTRIAHLTSMLHTLLKNYERDTGRPAPHEQAILRALEDVAFIPVEARRRARGAARNAARAASQRR